MARKWIKTESLGVYYREHPTRPFGIGKDKYYALFYKHEGKTRCEALDSVYTSLCQNFEPKGDATNLYGSCEC